MGRAWQNEICKKLAVSREEWQRTPCSEIFKCRNQFSTTAYLLATKVPKKPSIKSRKPQLEYKPRPPPPRPDLSTPRPKQDHNRWRYRKGPTIVGALSLFGFTTYCTYLAITLSRDPEHTIPKEAATQSDVSDRYDKIARSFDISVDRTEWLMGLPKLRRKLAFQAHGDVLEVSIGTGRNLEYYDWDFKGYNGVGKPARGGGLKKGKVRSFTAVDKSEEMLEIAHEKFSTMFPGILGVRWIIGDASKEIPPPPRNSNERSGNLEGQKYDTVTQTMGLCSADDPVALLRNLGNCVKEEEGRILLLEHGRGRWEWLNKILDKSAEGHANAFGCWWNRNMEEIVKESGLEIVKVDTWHGGTTWWIELKKPKVKVDTPLNNPITVLEKDEKMEAKTKTAQELQSHPQKKASWW